MKQFYYLIAFCVLVNLQNGYSQSELSRWSFEAGVNYVNVYSVGEDTPQGEFFDEYFNINDHWNLGTYFAGTRSFSDRLSLTAKVSFNEISKWGEDGNDVSVFVDHLEYYGLDGMVNFKILTKSKLKPYVAIGGGYTWIEEGPYNTYSTKESDDDFVGAGTVNGALGLTYDITDRFGVNLQFAYKHSFKEYLTKHFQNSVGVYYNLGKSTSKEETKEVLDTDNDGIEDAYDLCPEVAGKKEFAGCPDTDNDGIPDSLDKCPNEKNIDGGCPSSKSSIQETPSNTNNIEKSPVVIDTQKTVYFEYNSASLDNNAKGILDAIIEMSKNADTITLKIDGHTDNTGEETFNKSLSINRANNVKDYLVTHGIKSENITTNSFGESQPSADNSTEKGRALNRRAKLTIKIFH
ncbi:outer membrane protein OmpA-like peptidoglycan-associated protein/outer membrane protein W [Mesoflavibacter sabulilitoris]|uniref:OmpA-like domain-containing protein n=1 Tax=Mesoflavibacter zeaxanthinifaciens subsp. sabulilitoris TaxID=1520893 RepID=A0A2T1N644_9FLAO|nr:OmpA family protein [Mesoflavibacter zeaxanthinifaciens]MBB3123364.1 outer membrane protein OmpA-like peptidoglycan-associated protein/outer membrane protein W [Mesoflavibacter zeaxanthinifaciens subsp. sabulilitoris]PSG87004.1 hypothetical protein C7H61_12905 [Mesoflavibacter zeaxanthinifaciens subsp. sabulilitoris]